MRTRTGACLALFALALMLGCGGKQKLVKVEGKVLGPDGNPLPGATVRFIPLEGKGAPANGRTGDDGSFQLTTRNSNDGAAEGTYKIVISIDAEIQGGSTGGEVDPQALLKAGQEHMSRQKQGSLDKQRAQIHPNYSDDAKTPLRQQVPADGKVEIKLNKNGT